MPTGIIVSSAIGDKFAIPRTRLALERLGIRNIIVADNLNNAIKQAGTSVLLVRAGTILPKLITILPSSTGLPLVGYGRNGKFEENLTPTCVYLEKAAVRILGKNSFKLHWEEMIKAIITPNQKLRTVQIHGLNHTYDPKLRILQLITSLQLGGAERVVLDISTGLQQRGQRVWVATTSKPGRETFQLPSNQIDISKYSREHHPNLILQIVTALQIDIIHAHLISAQVCKEIRNLCPNTPLITTMHNVPEAWPAGFISETPVDSIISCSKLVGTLAKAKGIACKTVWNGIDEVPLQPSQLAKEQGKAWRASHSIKPNETVIGVIANPRRQKRLDFIPRILAALPKNKNFRCVVVGGGTNKDATQSLARLNRQASKYKSPITLVGTTTNTKDALHAFDVLLSVSRYEGLSLAHLEALAAGIPVIATNVGGAKEIAQELSDKSYYKLLSKSAPATKFAQAILTCPKPSQNSQLPKAFTRRTMAKRMEQVYKSAVANKATKDAQEIWIVTNNFSMGGAQSSARRLLTKWHNEGRKVRAITIQEVLKSKGATALEQAGVPLSQIIPEPNKDTDEHVHRILELAIQHKPKAIFFWNLITSYKLLISDAFRNSSTKVIDVSPGEMSFKSLLQYFQNPRRELPYRTTKEFGEALYKCVVKFSGEVSKAQDSLACPVEVIRNGIPLTPHHKRKGKKLIFSTAARISPDKRIEDLIEGFKIAHSTLPEYELHIAGRIENGAQEYYNKLKEQASGLPIKWLGELPSSAKLLATTDIFVMISEPAGCPNASLEALAAGIPVIATNVGGASEQVINGVNGYLTPRRDNASLAKAITKLSRNARDINRFGKAAKLHVSRNFSMKTMSTKYLSLS